MMCNLWFPFLDSSFSLPAVLGPRQFLFLFSPRASPRPSESGDKESEQRGRAGWSEEREGSSAERGKSGNRGLGPYPLTAFLNPLRFHSERRPERSPSSPSLSSFPSIRPLPQNPFHNFLPYFLLNSIRNSTERAMSQLEQIPADSQQPLSLHISCKWSDNASQCSDG
jgi:hypothetical protein